jgi:uncharacterized repeat protein (TIGR01451 family)
MNYYLIILSFLLLPIWGLWHHFDGQNPRSSISRWGLIAASTTFLTIGLNHLTSPLVSLIFASIASCAIGFIPLWGSQLHLPRTTTQQRIWSVVSLVSLLTSIELWQWSGLPELAKLGLTAILSSIAVLGLMTTWIRLRTWVITVIVTTSLVVSFQIQGTFTPAAFAANQTLSAGAYIVDMGQPTQTIANGLKPYGLIFDLVINKGIPVIWAINPTKVKDGVDFTANGKNYSGSAFIIAPEFATSAAATITTWKTQGVVVDGPLATGFTAPIFDNITSFPNSVLDLANGLKITGPYYANAGIPASSLSTGVFGTFNTYRQGDPSTLNSCDDIFILPHADPTWAAHKYLLPFNQLIKGYIWAGCHAVSVLEHIDGTTDPTLPFTNTNGTAPDLNFLSATNGLIPYVKTPASHNPGSPPYTYSPTLGSASPYQWLAADTVDPIMQFIGSLDAATLNGSEQIYLPLATGWRSTTKISVYDSSQADIPTLSPGPAAVVAYGRGFGNLANGMVMYEGGHDLNASTSIAANVAAQRAFFNFLLVAGIERRPAMTTNIPSPIISGTTVAVSEIGGSTYKWASDCGGSFSTPTASSTTFTAPVVSTNTTCNIRVAITDICSRRNFQVTSILIAAPSANVTINGTVWNDLDRSANGTFSNIKTGTEAGTNAVFGTTIVPVSAILVNGTTGLVLQSQVVGTNGTYSFAGVPSNTNVRVIVTPTAGTLNLAPPTATAPTGWANTSPLDTGIFNTGIVTQTKDFGICQRAKVVMVKRITKINGLTIDPNDNTNLAGVTVDTYNNAGNWPPNYLIGRVNAGLVKSGDTIEYTVYFLNNQGTDATNVKICDPIRGRQTYVANSIVMRLGAATTDTSLTDALDSADRASTYPANGAPSDCNAFSSTVTGTDNGGVAFGVTGTGASNQPNLSVIPGATNIGTPATSYGLFRFTTKVNP